MGRFDEIKSDYEKLMSTYCVFSLDNGSNINLVMSKENLPHLIGFQYMSASHSILRDFT